MSRYWDVYFPARLSFWTWHCMYLIIGGLFSTYIKYFPWQTVRAEKECSWRKPGVRNSHKCRSQTLLDQAKESPSSPAVGKHCGVQTTAFHRDLPATPGKPTNGREKCTILSPRLPAEGTCYWTWVQRMGFTACWICPPQSCPVPFKAIQTNDHHCGLWQEIPQNWGEKNPAFCFIVV